MEPSSPFYPLSPGAFGIPTASAFTWDFNQTVGREIVPLPRVATHPQPYPLPILSSCSPLPVPTNPLLWGKEDVERWLRWCTKEFALSNLDPKSFSMNGKALCLLPKESFRHRTAQSGDVLYEILQKLIYYNNYLNRQARNQEARYPSPPSNVLLQPTSRLSPANHSPTSSTPSVVHHTYRDYTNIVAGGHCENGMTSSSYDPKDAAATLGHGVVPTVPLNLKTADTQSSTPCSDSGNSSPGMAEDDHQQPLAHPLSRHGAANSSQIRNGHRYIEPDQHCRNTNKRHLSVSDLDEGHTMGARVSKRANTLDDTDIGLVESDIPRHCIMQRRPHEPVNHSTISESQRLPVERDSQLIFHRQADVIQQQHENSQNKMIPTYPIPISLPFLESCGPRAVFIRGDENRRLYHEDEIDVVEDDIFANGEKPSDCRLLWEFLSQLLRQEKYSPYIKWEDEEKRVFRIQDPTAIASLWGRQKNRTNMTYEKLSRALRYYYKTGIIQKEPGQKLTYRFLQDPKDIANSQRFSKGNRSKASNAPSPQQAATAEDFHDSCPSSPRSADDSSAINDTNSATTAVTCSPETEGDLKDSTVTDDRIAEMSKTAESRANIKETNNQRENVTSAAVEQSGNDQIRSESVLAMDKHCMVIKQEPCPTQSCHAE